ncbi:MAG: hypothetical protein MJE63_19530 [Proteobacteria bacterium]|nr:hypothetical protein [Pseudomonadota bacterium]
MDLNHLMETAQQLKQPNAESVAEYSRQKDHLLSQINRLMSEREDIETMIGKGNHAMMRDNHHNHIQFMESVFLLTKPEVLVETVVWVFKVYRSRGFLPTYWAAQLSSWKIVLENALSNKAFAEIWPFYQWMIVNTPVFSKLSE